MIQKTHVPINTNTDNDLIAMSKSRTKTAARITTKHDSPQHCARDTLPFTRCMFAPSPKETQLFRPPKANSKRSVASRQQMLAGNNQYVTANPDNDSQDACSLHHQTTRSPVPIPESKKCAFAHSTTGHVNAQPAPQFSPVVIAHTD